MRKNLNSVAIITAVVLFSIMASSCNTTQESFGMYKSQNPENLSKEKISSKNESLQNFNSTVRIDNPHPNSLVNFANITSPKSNHTSKKKKSFRSSKNSEYSGSLVSSECIPYTYVDPEVIKISDAIRITLLGSSDVSALRDNINHLKELSNIVVNQKIWIKTQNEIVRSFKDLPKEFKHLYNLGLIGEIEVRYSIMNLCIGCEDELIAKSALACKKNLDLVKKAIDDKKLKQELLFNDIKDIKLKTISELPKSEPIIPLNQDKVNEEEKVNAELIKSKEEAIKSQQHLDDLKKEAEKATSNLEELKSQYKKEHTKFEGMQKELKVLTNELQQKEKTSTKLTENIKKLESSIAKYKSDYEQKVKEKNSLSTKLDDKDLTDKKRKEYELCIANLKEELAKLQQTITRIEAERNECLKKQAELQYAINNLQIEVKEKDKTIYEHKLEIKRYNDQIESDEKKIDQQKKEIKRIIDNWPHAAWKWFKRLFR